MKKNTTANKSTSINPLWKDRIKNWFNPYDPSKLAASELKPVAVEESKIKKSNIKNQIQLQNSKQVLL